MAALGWMLCLSTTCLLRRHHHHTTAEEDLQQRRFPYSKVAPIKIKPVNNYTRQSSSSGRDATRTGRGNGFLQIRETSFPPQPPN